MENLLVEGITAQTSFEGSPEKGPLRICSVPAPYFLRIKVPLCGAGTEETRPGYGSDPFRYKRKRD